MKNKVYLFIFTFALALCLYYVVSVFQSKIMENRLTGDVESKAKSTAESIAISAGAGFVSGNSSQANQLVQDFEKRKRIQGCIIYGPDGNIIAESGRFHEAGEKDSTDAARLMAKGQGGLLTGKLEEYDTVRYIAPVMRNGHAAGAIEVIYDISYISSRANSMAFNTAIIAACFIILIILMIYEYINRIFIQPSRNLDEMVYRLNKRGLWGKSKNAAFFSNIMRDIEDEAFSKAYVDGMTGLKNYRYYYDVLAKVLKSGGLFYLAIMDIDGIKSINKDYGHETGDAVIRSVAEIIFDHVEEACRFSGEEFIFLSSHRQADFIELCNKIRTEVETGAAKSAAERTGKSIEKPVTISAGIACTREVEKNKFDNPEIDLFKMAEGRLFKAKQSGKNRIVSGDE